MRVDVGDEQTRKRELLLIAQILQRLSDGLSVSTEISEAEFLDLRDRETHAFFFVDLKIRSHDLVGRTGENNGTRAENFLCELLGFHAGDFG